MAVFKNADGKTVLLKMVKSIQRNKAYLGEVDGLIGDGDHGMNMNKGFTVFETRFGQQEFTFTEGLNELAMILLNEIGGSMGPIYGTLLMNIGEAGEGLEDIKLEDFANMLETGFKELCEIVDARVGDKTLIDSLAPAVESLKNSVKSDEEYTAALDKMKMAAAEGRNSTKDMVAKFGRSSRLGERSRGVLDAGATSCCIILTAMADGIKEVLI